MTAGVGVGDGVHDAATAFSDAAAVYEHARPGYPPVALAWLGEHLALGPGRRVLDLAAGTGKLSRGLLEQGATVLAVEPVETPLSVEQIQAVIGGDDDFDTD